VDGEPVTTLVPHDEPVGCELRAGGGCVAQLTARVFVNRVWHYHFGRGIIGTLANFGQLDDRPTHPRLLDPLAVGFKEADWSTKWLHRQFMRWRRRTNPSVNEGRRWPLADVSGWCRIVGQLQAANGRSLLECLMLPVAP
jgi:hypothetical protein